MRFAAIGEKQIKMLSSVIGPWKRKCTYCNVAGKWCCVHRAYALCHKTVYKRQFWRKGENNALFVFLRIHPVKSGKITNEITSMCSPQEKHKLCCIRLPESWNHVETYKNELVSSNLHLQVQVCSISICMQWTICRFRFMSQGKYISSSAVFHFMLRIQLQCGINIHEDSSKSVI